MVVIFLLFIFLQGTNAVIYRLNATEYARMPPLIQLDPYKQCQLDSNALYCSAEVVLVSDKPSQLLDMIKEYSEHQTTHFNHTKLYYGVCLKKTCKKFYKEENADLKLILEACLNESLSEKYELKAKVADKFSCKPPDKLMGSIDTLDIVVAAIYLFIFLASVVGSLCDYFIEQNKEDKALRYLLCFSLKRNWKKLTSVKTDQDPRVERLRSFHGLRVTNMYLMIMSHSLLVVLSTISNPEFMEEMYVTYPDNGILNGTLIMQTFLLTSGFLVIYNSLLYAEKHNISWLMLPKYIIIRYLRLTPAYALILALHSTWSSHFNSGPLWPRYGEIDKKDCRKYWWRHLLYINNYFETKSYCLVPSWYLATDTQLYILSVIIFLTCRTKRSRIITISSLYVVGMIIPGILVYLKDLDGIQMIPPEASMDLFRHDPQYFAVYIPAHTNLPGSLIGIALAYLIYHWQKNGDVEKYRTLPYRLFYWSMFPLVVLCVVAGAVFYLDGPRLSIYIRTAYAVLTKPIFGLAVAILVASFVLKLEDVYRPLLEWRGWIVLSRLTYCNYLLHDFWIKQQIYSKTHTSEIGYSLMMEIGIFTVIVTVASSLVFWMLVESPISNVLKEFLKTPDKKEKVADEKTSSTPVPNIEQSSKNSENTV